MKFLYFFKICILLRKDKNFFEVVFLSANNNYKKLIQQAKEFNVKNILIKNQIFHERTKRSLKNSKTKVYSGDISLTNIISKKLDYTMAAIVGVAGLQPTIDAIKISKTVALANKESIICGWEILSKLIKKYKTKILPVDSEHFSIMELTKNISDEEVEEIIITASGGPFLNMPQNKLNYVKPKQAINHPNWKMGKKISIDSANLMNKVFEVIEACKIFKFSKDKYRIMIHPQSYVHSIIRFKNCLIKMILFNTDSFEEIQKKYKLIEKSISEVGFKNTANLYSVSDSAKLGGQVGWIDESKISEIIKKEISKLKVGEYTKPITIPGGFLIIHLDDKKTQNIYLNFDEEFEKQITYEKNTQLEQYSTIYFKKINKNSIISEK